MNPTRLLTASLALAVLAGTGTALAQYSGQQQPYYQNQQQQYDRQQQQYEQQRQYEQQQQYYGQQQQPYYGQQPYAGQHWRNDGEQAAEQRGFQDGVFGADRDFQNHRRPDVNNRDEYRSPRNIPGWAAHEYREGFRNGYYHRVREIYRNYR